MPTIRKIMEKNRAVEILNEIKLNICDNDLDYICQEALLEEEINENNEATRKLLQGIMCGLVFWDEQEKCLVQTLINPVKAGSLELDKLYYKNKITFGSAKGFKATNQVELTINAIATLCARPTQLIEQMYGQDLTIATACVNFFDK